MTRKEQIEQAKAELFPIGDNGRSYEQALSASGFDLGVKWADEHPRKGLVDIDKVIEWLINHVNDYIVNDKLDSTKERDWLKVKSDCFDDLRKAMEE